MASPLSAPKMARGSRATHATGCICGESTPVVAMGRAAGGSAGNDKDQVVLIRASAVTCRNNAPSLMRVTPKHTKLTCALISGSALGGGEPLSCAVDTEACWTGTHYILQVSFKLICLTALR